jgi:patatin-like phospholipase/acyl hydrolase
MCKSDRQFLDGGGIRGLSSLYILKGLMQELNSPPGGPYFPHEHFDLIAGTSTGG